MNVFHPAMSIRLLREIQDNVDAMAGADEWKARNYVNRNRRLMKFDKRPHETPQPCRSCAQHDVIDIHRNGREESTGHYCTLGGFRVESRSTCDYHLEEKHGNCKHHRGNQGQR